MDKSENKEVKKVLSKQAIFVLLLLVFIVGVGISYALYSFSVNFLGKNENTISTCSINLSVDENNPINLAKAFPVDDSVAETFEPYTFTVTKGSGSCSNISYNLSMVNVCDGYTENGGIYTSGTESINCNSGYVIDPAFIKYKIVRKTITSDGNVDETVENPVFTGNDPTKISIDDNLNASSKYMYEITLWIDSKAKNANMYVPGSDGDDYLTNEDGSYVTRNFVTKVKLDVKGE